MLPAAEIQILKRSDGSEWRLGAGGFGTVYKAMRNGVQPVAVKVLGVVSGDRDWGSSGQLVCPGMPPCFCNPRQILQGLPGQLCAPHKLNSAQTPPHTLHGSASPPPSSSCLPAPQANSEAVKSMSDEDFVREISILRACRDTNILQVCAACCSGCPGLQLLG